MSKVPVKAEIDIQSVIAGLTNLKISELEDFARELSGLITRKKTKDKGLREKELLALITQTTLPVDKRNRYLELSEKVEDETITEKEHVELLNLVEKEEGLRAERVKLLLELAQIKNISMPQLMEQLGLNPPGRG